MCDREALPADAELVLLDPRYDRLVLRPLFYSVRLAVPSGC